MSDLLKEFSLELMHGCKPDANNPQVALWYSAQGFEFDGVSMRSGLKSYELDWQFSLGGTYAVAGSLCDITEKDPNNTFEVLTGAYAGKDAPIFRGQIATQYADGKRRFFAGLNERLFMWANTIDSLQGVTVTEVSQHTGGAYFGSIAEGDSWSFMSWGNWMAATNGQDLPQIYKGTAFADLAGFASGTQAGFAKILINRNPFAIAMNLEDYPQDIAWCNADDIENWTPSADNLAGRLTARGLSSEINAACSWGTDVAFFSFDELCSLDFVGAPLVFGITPRVRGIGANGKHAVVSVGQMLYGSGPGGIWRSDGSSYEYIDVGAVRRYIDQRFITTLRQFCHTSHDPANATVWFYFPYDSNIIATGTIYSPEQHFSYFGVGYNYKHGTWCQSIEPVSGISNFGVWPFQIISTGGKLAVQSASLQQPEDAFWVIRQYGMRTVDKYAASTVLDFDRPDAIKHISEIQFDITMLGYLSAGSFLTPENSYVYPQNSHTLPTGLKFKLLYKINEADAWSTTAVFTMQSASEKLRFQIGVEGRYFSLVLIESHSAAIQAIDWELHKIRFYGFVQGETGR